MLTLQKLSVIKSVMWSKVFQVVHMDSFNKSLEKIYRIASRLAFSTNRTLSSASSQLEKQLHTNVT